MVLISSYKSRISDIKNCIELMYQISRTYKWTPSFPEDQSKLTGKKLPLKVLGHGKALKLQRGRVEERTQPAALLYAGSSCPERVTDTLCNSMFITAPESPASIRSVSQQFTLLFIFMSCNEQRSEPPKPFPLAIAVRPRNFMWPHV